MRAVGYIRVSTEEQAKDGLSLEAQQAAIESYARFRGLDLNEIFVDAGVTSKVPMERRERGRLFLAAVRPGMAVIAFKLDRMFRNTVECLSQIEQWERFDIAVHFIDLGGQAVDTRSAMGRFFLTVMAAVAELERNQIGERTAAVKAHQRNNGRFCGGYVPWGFRLGSCGALVVDEEEQNAILEAKRLRKKGLSFRNIGNKLLERDFRPRQGRSWGPEQIKNLLGAGDLQG